MIHTFLRLAALGCIVTLAAGCASRQAGRPMNVTPTADGAVVEVELDEYVIRMPDILPPGRITFNVKNVGTHRHTIAIRAEGAGSVDSTLKPDLEGGQSAVWTVNLTPGTYRVWCPVGPHSALGMKTTVTVAPAR